MLDFSSIKCKRNHKKWVFRAKDDNGNPCVLTSIKNPKRFSKVNVGGGCNSAVISKYAIHCPFHKEKTPSCIILKHDGLNTGDATFHCLGCGKSGDCSFEEIESIDIGDRDFEFEQETFQEIMSFGSEHLLEILAEIKIMFKEIEDGVEELDQRILLAYFNAIIRYAIMLDDKLKGKY